MHPPQQFYQLVQFSDGSTIHIPTTSPRPILRLTKDNRNNVLWNPEMRMAVGEGDESGMVGKFKRKYEGLDEFDFDEASVLDTSTPSNSP